MVKGAPLEYRKLPKMDKNNMENLLKVQAVVYGATWIQI